MKVRIIKAIFLFVILFTSATSVAQSFSVDNYKYEFKEDYTITVTGHNDNTVTELIIPKRVIYNNM